jgi:hypothetical protein
VPYEEGGEDLRRIEELLGREGASPMSGGPAAKDLPTQNLEHDRYDSRLWRELCEVSGELEDLARAEGAPQTFAALLGDLFLSYFKAQPNLLPEEGVEPWPCLGRAAQAIKHHHERYDGGGYPEGLAGEQIPLPARIVAAAEAYEVMVSGRPYQNPLPPTEAIGRLFAEAGDQFDARVVAALARVVV